MKQFAKSAVKRSFDLVGLELRRKLATKNDVELEEGSLVVPKIWDQPLYQRMIPFRLKNSTQPLILLGSNRETDFIRPELVTNGRMVEAVEWNWESGSDIGSVPLECLIVVCKLASNEHQWRVIKDLRQRHGSNVISIQELVLPFNVLREGQESLEYTMKSLTDIAPMYVGQTYFGPLKELNSIFPLAGKTVIEFGPMEGAQTAGLLNLGAKSVTCIEARGVNFIKTMIAQYCFDWDNVSLIMDDFHNADAMKYGRFDLAFAHGVYYHSFAPFFFFENLMSLSDNILIGGYVTVPDPPPGPPSTMQYGFEKLEYEGKSYRVKRFKVGGSYNTGINQFAYHLDRDDLIAFFSDRGYEVTVLSDEAIHDPWGDWFIRFLASKKTS
jgi:hypothetical protein